MKVSSRPPSNRGFAVLLVLLLSVAAVIILAGILDWSSVKSNNAQRAALSRGALSVADSVLSKVIGQMSLDFQNSGSATMDQNLSQYSQWIAPPGTGAILANYAIYDANGNLGQISVARQNAWASSPLAGDWSGLYGNNATYTLACQVQDLTAPPPKLAAALRINVQFAYVPVFQFGAFYAPDLEICPWINLTLSGWIHSNGNIYCQPAGSTLTLTGPATACQTVMWAENPLDTTVRPRGTLILQQPSSSHVKSLNIPIGVSDAPANLHGLIEIPPTTESSSSAMGQQRYYNKADLIILVNNGSVTAKSGLYNGFITSIPWSIIQNFVNTNVSFFDKRENKTIQASQIDVGQFNQSYVWLWFYLGRAVRTLFIADLRTQSSATEPGIRLMDAQTFPWGALAVATPDPLYIWGNFNAPDSYLGTTNTTASAPVSVAADAVTLLSRNWRDNQSGASLAARKASSATFNAALLCGIVPTGNGYYSGGLENQVRLLEDWTGQTITFNGSRVTLYYSAIATAPWGASGQVYNPPGAMIWSFDPNFSNASLLPPSAPNVRTTIRAAWTQLKPSL